MFKTTVAGIAAVGIAAGMLAFAPAASADNYAPQLPSNVSKPGARISLTIEGAQAGCRVTYTFQYYNPKNKKWTFVRKTRTGVELDGTATSSLKAPKKAGRYRLITRVDNFPGETGCTPTKTVQTVLVR